VREVAVYVAAGVAYIALGLLWPDALLSWVEGAGFLFLVVWILPAVVRRLR
jgi:hypothetical protein